MEVILLERVGNLGNIGAVVTVANGYARNFLIPRGKALRANKANLAVFEAKKAELERANAEAKAAAEGLVERFSDLEVVIKRQSGEDGKLYGSVTASDVAKAVSERIGVKIDPHSIVIEQRFKDVGNYQVHIVLHPEVKTALQISVVRSDA